MSGSNLDFARQLLRKGENDLFTAGCVLREPQGPTDTPCFHAQQPVEKAIKAVLTACGIRFGRTHDLMPLLDDAACRVPELAQYRAACAQLSAYAVAVRYPEDLQDPTREEAGEALQWAQEIHTVAARFLADLCPDGTRDADAGE